MKNPAIKRHIFYLIKNTSIICMLLVISYYSICQSNKEDSLNHVLNLVYIKPDTNRVKTLLALQRIKLLEGAEKDVIKLLDEALSISEKARWNKGKALALQRYGVWYGTFKGEYDKAIKYYLQGLNINQQFKSDEYEAGSLGNIGLMLSEIGQYKNALNYLLRAKEVQNRANLNQVSMINVDQALANVYFEIGKKDTSLILHRKIFDFTRRKGLLLNHGLSANAIGKMMLDTNVDSSFWYLSVANNIADSINMPILKASVLANIAAFLANKKQYAKSISTANEALKIAKNINSIQWISDVNKILSEIYEKAGNNTEGYKAFKRYILYRDSSFSQQKKQEIAVTQVQFDYDKKEAILQASHQDEIKHQQTIRNGIMGGSGVLLLGGLTSFFFYKRRRDAIARQKEAEFKADVSDTEMKALRAQMNPHFIFNSLNSISDYINKNNPQLADEYLNKFARLMRLILENSEQKEVPLADDLEALELYMQLEALRTGNKFTYSIQTDDAIDKENTLIPPLLLQPFVENSIWHGIHQKQGTGHINIHIKKENEKIICIVEDNGIGNNQPQLTQISKIKKKPLGMKITQARIDILNKINSVPSLVNIAQNATGTRVEISLPLEHRF